VTTPFIIVKKNKDLKILQNASVKYLEKGEKGGFLTVGSIGDAGFGQ
jgi:hypothetical protein